MTKQATQKRVNRGWIIFASIIYLLILVSRVWGAHRFLHFEESLAVGASRSLPIGAVWNDHTYGFFFQWLCIEASTFFNLSLSPLLLVAFSTVIWLICAVSVYIAIIRSGFSPAVAFLGPFALCLLPLPDTAFMGLITSLGFPLAIAAIVITSVSDLPKSRPILFFELFLLFSIAASSPPALVGAVIAAMLWLGKIGSRQTHLLRAVAILLGTALSAFIARIQDPPMTYIGNWVPSTNADRATFERLSDAGAFITRERASVGVVDTVKNFPGTLRFIVTQFYPEPWASRAILETGGVAKLLQVVIPILAVSTIVVLLARLRASSVLSQSVSVAQRLLLAAAMSVIVQHVLVGQLTLRQYLFMPVALFWMAILVLLGGAINARSSRAIVFLLPLVFVFAYAAAQNFRDPFQENPRQGGTGRYSEVDLWRPALETARAKCRNLDDDTVVVVSQFDPENPVIKQMIKTSGLEFAWFDHPFVARCYVINGG